MPSNEENPEQAPNPSGTPLGGLKDAIKAIAGLGEKDIPGATPQQIMFIRVVTVLSILALAVAGGFLWRGECLFAFDLTIVAILLPITVFVVLFKKQLTAIASWHRVVPRLPLKPSALDEIGQLLEHIRKTAFDCLYPMNTSLQDRQIRGNIFLADYSKAAEGIAFELFMPEELRKNMNHPPEWLLRFYPGQGATGCVFVEGDQKVARRRPTDEGEWESVFKMTEELKQKVHKDLKWIVSLPLKERASQTTLAVLNIDGLDYEFTDEQFALMVKSFIRDFRGLEMLMASQPKVNLSTRMEEA